MQDQLCTLFGESNFRRTDLIDSLFSGNRPVKRNAVLPFPADISCFAQYSTIRDPVIVNIIFVEQEVIEPDIRNIS